MLTGLAAHMAAARVREVQNSTVARYRLAADFYHGTRATKERRRFGLAELSFLRWEIERGVLDQPTAEGEGSPWWRAVNNQLLRDKVEADLLADACAATGVSSHSVQLWLEFIQAPSAVTWYRAHNASIIAGYLSRTNPSRRANSPSSAS